MVEHGRKWYLPVLRATGFVLSLFTAPVFRAMKTADDGLPQIGDSARQLGVRIGVDVEIGEDGLIRAKSGGMSVAIDSPNNLQTHRRS